MTSNIQENRSEITIWRSHRLFMPRCERLMLKNHDTNNYKYDFIKYVDHGGFVV